MLLTSGSKGACCPSLVLQIHLLLIKVATDFLSMHTALSNNTYICTDIRLPVIKVDVDYLQMSITQTNMKSYIAGHMCWKLSYRLLLQKDPQLFEIAYQLLFFFTKLGVSFIEFRIITKTNFEL